ncbi:hypothetical protein AGMMS49992_28510 [Clostridia bacterium]|nr:hypothetical protein AGMMS49992_28510 [Clostridia bacterium]
MNIVNSMLNNFYWSDIDWQSEQSPQEKYQQFIRWAGHARGKNPNAFDQVTEWILDDAEWTADKFAQNRDILMNGLIARFKDQTIQLRAWLKELEPHGVVNEAIWELLDKFERQLSGDTLSEFQEAVTAMFSDFSVMQDREIRKQIAGERTGPAGVDTVKLWGYINELKGCDASVQWALFMPQVVKLQQNGFEMSSFELKKLPAMRFIGKERYEGNTDEWRHEIVTTLDGMTGNKSGFDYDILLGHHYGLGVDVGQWHGFWGRFMKADTPVPEGFVSFDFIPESDGKSGLPFMSQFAYATFSGDMAAIHRTEGYDVDAMYDVTRNTMLGANIPIPYPHKYWTAEVFLDGCNKWSTAYMFSAEI